MYTDSLYINGRQFRMLFVLFLVSGLGKNGKHVKRIKAAVRTVIKGRNGALLSAALTSDDPDEVISEAEKALKTELTEFQKEYVYKHRGHAYVKRGMYDEAKADAEKAGDAELDNIVSKATVLFGRLNKAADSRTLTELFKLSPRSAFVFVKRAEMALVQNNLQAYAGLSREAILLDPDNMDMFLSRAKVLFCAGFIEESLESLRLFSSNKDVRTARNQMQRVIIGFRENLSYVSAKTVKGNVDAIMKSLSACNTSCMGYCSASDNIIIQLSMAKSHLMVRYGKREEALELLTNLIEQNDAIPELFVDRGNLYAEAGKYNEAEQDYRAAFGLTDDRIGLEALQNLRKLKIARMRERKDNGLYKILGLSPECSESQIHDAFKAKSEEWQPDRFTNTGDKKRATDKLKQINRAYIVLSDINSRRLYDKDTDEDDDGNIVDEGELIEFQKFPIFDILHFFAKPFRGPANMHPMDPFAMFG